MISVSSAWPVRASAAPAHHAGSLFASTVWRHQPAIFKKIAKAPLLPKPSKTVCPPRRRLALPSAADSSLKSWTSARPLKGPSCLPLCWKKAARPQICLLSSSRAGLRRCKAAVSCVGALASAAFHGRFAGLWPCWMSRWWSSAWRAAIRLCTLGAPVLATAWWQQRSRFQLPRPIATV